jgi:hypothetical protein
MDVVDLALGQAVAVDWSAEQYFTDRTALTRSALCLLAENPAEFERYWDHGERRKFKGSVATDFGTSAHLALLEPPEWTRRLGLPLPPKPRKGGPSDDLVAVAASCGVSRADLERMIPSTTEQWKTAIDARARLLAGMPERIDVSLHDYFRLLRVQRSVWAHPQASTLLHAPGNAEQTIVWREPTSGLLVKVRIDKLSEVSQEAADDVDGIAPGLAIVDLKTTRAKGRRAPWVFAKHARELGYHVQNALYLDATRAAFGDGARFYFVAVCNEGDFETSTWQLPDEAVEQGREIYQNLLLEVCERRETFDWRHGYTRGVTILPWSYRR